MKKILVGLILVLSLSTFAMADEGRGMMGQRMMGSQTMEMVGIGGNPWFHHGVSLTLVNSDKLGLDEKQKGQLEEIRTKYTKELIRQDAEMQIAELDLNSLLKTDATDLAKVKDVIKKATDTRSQIRYLRIEAFAEARKVLTEEQKGKLRNLMENPDCMMGDDAKGITGGMMGRGMMEG
ncbi:MAG TPA: hypothetical protein DCZ97_03820 [Syntrophus sp. (in: bacteria)]|nr:hypothetical protein [Syntrophus sp. (in: bacteria)]